MSEWISNQNTVTHSPGNIMSYEKFWKPLRRFQDFDRLGAQSIVDVIKGIQYIMGGINGREASWCLRTGWMLGYIINLSSTMATHGYLDQKKTMLATHSFWTYQVKRTDRFMKGIRGKALGKALSSDVLDLPTCKLCVRGKVANLNPYGEICHLISTFLWKIASAPPSEGYLFSNIVVGMKPGKVPFWKLHVLPAGSCRHEKSKKKIHYLDNHHDLTWLGNTATPHPTHNTHSNPHPSTSGPHPGIGLSQKITTQVHPHPSLEVAHHSPRCYARLCSCRDPLRQVPGSGFRGFWLVGNHRGIFCWGSGTGRVHLLKFNFIPLINTRPSTKEFSKTRRYLLRSININSTL